MATNSWQTATSGVGARASQLNQLLNALTQAQDIGQGAGLYQPIANPGALTATVSTATGNLTGAYTYVVVFATGGANAASGYFPSGNTTAAGTVSNTVTPSAQAVDLSAIPLGPTGTIGRDLYRTDAGGSVYYFLDTIQDNTTTTYTDNTADSSLGTAIAPTVNTTGTPWSVPVYPSYPGFNGTTGAMAGQVVSGGTSAPIWWDGVHWQQIPLWTTANQWQTAQTFGALATFSAGITGSGTTGTLTAGSGILGTANPWTAAQTFNAGATFGGSTTFSAAATFNGGTSIPSGQSLTLAGSILSSGSVNQFFSHDLNVHYPTAPVGTAWAIFDVNALPVFRAYADGTKVIATVNNTLDNGTTGASTTKGLATFQAGLLTEGWWMGTSWNANGSQSFDWPGTNFGTFLAWNMTGAGGESDLVNLKQGGNGGFTFWLATGATEPITLDPLLAIRYTGAIGLNSITPDPVAGALSQSANTLYLGNGSVAQPIPTGGEYEIATLLLPNGTSGYAITTTTISDASGVGANVLINTLPANGTVALEASFTAGSNAETTNVALWDITAGAVVAGSTITTTNTAMVLIRSGSITLTAGHQYQAIAYYTAGSGNTGYIYSARLIAAF